MNVDALTAEFEQLWKEDRTGIKLLACQAFLNERAIYELEKELDLPIDIRYSKGRYHIWSPIFVGPEAETRHLALLDAVSSFRQTIIKKQVCDICEEENLRTYTISPMNTGYVLSIHTYKIFIDSINSCTFQGRTAPLGECLQSIKSQIDQEIRRLGSYFNG